MVSPIRIASQEGHEYLEGQGDLVSMEITPIIHMVPLVVHIINLLADVPLTLQVGVENQA